MKNSLYIVSLRYAPGNWQHMKSFAGRLFKQGYPVRFLMSSDYRWINEVYDDVTDYTSTSNSLWGMLWSIITFFWTTKQSYRTLFQNSPPSGLLLVMWHPSNFLLVRLTKQLYPNIPIVIWLHEPYKDQKKVYGVKAIAIWLIEWLQSLSLHYTDAVILHSERALRLFKSNYKNYKGFIRMIPLQFQDDGFEESARHYISFLGRADRPKGIEAFFSLVEQTAQNGMDLEFLIITPSNIERFLKALSLEGRQLLKVINKNRISDEDLRDGAANSLAVLALYKETMQSGVIPVALMKGTPVIGTDIEGITEWIRDKETGVIVSANPSIDEIIAAIHYIRDHIKEMIPKCRSYYLATFDDRNWERHYGWLRNLLTEPNANFEYKA